MTLTDIITPQKRLSLNRLAFLANEIDTMAKIDLLEGKIESMFRIYGSEDKKALITSIMKDDVMGYLQKEYQKTYSDVFGDEAALKLSPAG